MQEIVKLDSHCANPGFTGLISGYEVSSAALEYGAPPGSTFSFAAAGKGSAVAANRRAPSSQNFFL